MFRIFASTLKNAAVLDQFAGPAGLKNYELAGRLLDFEDMRA